MISIELMKPMLLILLALSGNFLTNLLPCSYQYQLNNSMVFRHIILFFIIFFTLDVTQYLINNNNNNIVDPSLNIFYSFIVFLFYWSFSKQSFKFVVVIIILAIIYYINNSYIDYFEFIEIEYNILYDLKKYIPIVTIIILMIGNLRYFYKQYYDHKKDFSIIKFILGKRYCDSFNSFKDIDMDNDNKITKKEFREFFKFSK